MSLPSTQLQNPSQIPPALPAMHSPTYGPPFLMGRGFPQGMGVLRVSYGLQPVRYLAPASSVATAAGALAWPRAPHGQLQGQNPQRGTVFSTVRCGKWRGDKWTLFYNIKNVTPFGNM